MIILRARARTVSMMLLDIIGDRINIWWTIVKLVSNIDLCWLAILHYFFCLNDANSIRVVYTKFPDFPLWRTQFWFSLLYCTDLWEQRHTRVRKLRRDVWCSQFTPRLKILFSKEFIICYFCCTRLFSICTNEAYFFYWKYDIRIIDLVSIWFRSIIICLIVRIYIHGRYSYGSLI